MQSLPTYIRTLIEVHRSALVGLLCICICNSHIMHSVSFGQPCVCGICSNVHKELSNWHFQHFLFFLLLWPGLEFIVHRTPNVAVGSASRCCSSVHSQSRLGMSSTLLIWDSLLTFVISVSANFDADVLLLTARGGSVSLRVFFFCCVLYNQLAFLLLLPSSGWAMWLPFGFA